MFMRSAATAAAVTMGGAVFMAGAAAGAGLTLAALGTACLARRAMRRRGDWGPDHHHHDSMAGSHGSTMPGGEEPHPGIPA